VVKETPTTAASSTALVSAAPVEDLGPVGTLDVTIADLPARWNEMSAANGSPILLADPLVADDTSDGVSSVSVPVGDGTLFVQWQEGDGKVLILQIDVPIADDPSTTTAIPMLESFAHAGLGLSTAASSDLIATTLHDAVAEAIDPSYVEALVQSGSADLSVSILDGAGSFIITPTLDDGASDDGASPSAQ